MLGAMGCHIGHKDISVPAWALKSCTRFVTIVLPISVVVRQWQEMRESKRVKRAVLGTLNDAASQALQHGHECGGPQGIL